MSRKFQSKNKDLVNLTVITSSQAWDKNVKRKGKPTLSKQYEFYGRIDKGSTAFITNTNLIGENHKFVEDTAKLPKNLKNKVVDHFKNQNRRVVYLVKKQSSTRKTSAKNKNFKGD